MSVIKKKLDGQKIEEALDCFVENPPPIPEISLQGFITTHFEKLEKVGKNLKALHEFLTSEGFDVGTYRSFLRTFQRVKRTREGKGADPSAVTPVPQVQVVDPPQVSLAPVPKESAAVTEHKDKAQTEDMAKKTELYGNQPIKGADGVNYYIDPSTGGKEFDF